MKDDISYEIIKGGLADTSEAPRGTGIFYRCTQCGDVIPSNPRSNVGCSCGNVFIDVDYFRLAVRDYAKFQAIRKQQ
jgi:hypothetical protein